MDRRPDDLERNMSRRPSNPLGQLTSPSSTPAINGAQASQAVLPQANPNGSGATTRRFGHPQRHGQGLVPPPAVAPPPQQTSRSSAAAMQPLDGKELAKLVTTLDNLASQPFHPRIPSCPLVAQPYKLQAQQQQSHPIRLSGHGNWDAGSTSRAPRPAGGSARSTRLAAAPEKPFEVYLRENGVSIPVVDDDAVDDCNALVAAFLADDEPVAVEASGPVESVGENRVLPAPVANVRSSGLRRDQLGLDTVPSSVGVDDGVGSRCSGRRAEAAAARKRRGRKMAEKKAEAARARAQKLAAARGSGEGTQPQG